MADGAKIVITADDADVRAAMQRVSNVVQESMGQIQGHFAAFQAGFEKVNMIMAAATAALAGGKVFKESVEGVKSMTLEATSLARILGISAEEANVLNTALGNVFLDKDTYLDASRQITKQLNSNGEAFKQLGISTRDAQGHVLPMQEIIQNTTAKLMEFKEGADRNIMANQLLGKSWEDVLKLSKLTPEVMADAAKEVKDYHKELDPAAVQRYREALENSGDAFEGIKIAIGKSAMPALSTLGEWLSSVGPGLTEIMIEAMTVLEAAFDAVAVVVKFLWETISTIFSSIADLISACFGGESITTLQFFVNCLKVIQAAFIGLRVGIELAVEGIKLTLAVLVESCIRVATAVSRALMLDFEGAKSAWKQGADDLAGILEESGKRQIAIAEKGRADLEKTLMPSDYDGKSNAGAKGAKSGNRSAVAIDKSKDSSRVSDWDNQLEAQKMAFAKQQDAAGTFYEFRKEQERDYWKAIIGRHDLSSAERIASEKKYYALSTEIRKKDFEGHIAQQKTELDSYQNNMDAKLAIAQNMAAEIGQRFGLESKEYQAQQQQIIQIEKQKKAQLKQLAEEGMEERKALALDSVTVEQQAAQQRLDLGLVNKEQMIELERSYEEERYQISRMALNERLTLIEKDPDYNPVEYQKLKDQMLQIDRKHQIDKQQLNNKLQVEKNQPQLTMFKSMETSFASSITNMLTRAQTLRQGLAGIFSSTYAVFMQEMISKPAAAWIAGKARELAVHLGFLGAKQAADTTAAGATVATKGVEATAVVGANAAEAASGAAASVASIPYVGWAMAAGVFAATMAMVMGAGSSIKSASGGYSIPRGTNPITQLHEEEMVLPKTESNFIRDLAANGVGGGKGTESAGGTVNYHDYSGKLSRDQIRQNAKVIAEEVSRITKRGWAAS